MNQPQRNLIVRGTREQLFHLLAEAAEVEHTLMCSYLYAAFSLKTADELELKPDEASAIARWREVIMSVAMEEMVHLVLVANLSMAIGARPHFDRPNFPIAPGYFPSGLVVKLTPFSMETLEHFIFVERPQGVALPDGEGFEHDDTYVREEAYHGVMPSVQDYATVGELYTALRLNFAAASRRLGEEALFVGPSVAQVGRDAVDLEGIITISGMAGVTQAIDTIVEQGEGSTSDRADSHFQRFVSIRDEFERLVDRNPQFVPAWPAAENPVMRRPPEPEDKVFIDDVDAARVLDFGNGIYAMIVRCLVQAFGNSGPDAGRQQKEQLALAIDLMHVLGKAGKALARLPASPAAPGVHAGMTFTMLRGVESLFRGPIERKLAVERLRELVHGARIVGRATPALVGVGDTLEALIARLEPDDSRKS